ncbi:MAG: hypothetical protein ACYDGY_04980 [Acidimicrobiales bacterium]
MNSTSGSEIYQLGCNPGKADASHNSNSLVFLDFGGQNNANNGTLLPKINTPVSYSTVEYLAEQFASGYYICTGADTTSVLTLAVGTNNSAYAVNYGGGQSWGNVVSAVGSDVVSFDSTSQVIVSGGNDIESWGSASGTLPWTSGIAANAPYYFYLDYGSADGCPQTVSSSDACFGGWTQYDYWEVSWGNGIGEAGPEIYTTSASQATEWALISAYGANAYSNPIGFYTVLDEYDLDSSTNNPTQAWTQMWDALTFWGVSPASIPFSSEVFDET